MNKIILKYFLITAILIIISGFFNSAYTKQRKLKISGMEIYTEKQLINILGLYRYRINKMSARKVCNTINYFYQKRGYIIVKTYMLSKNNESLSIYIDEGRIGKIIFRNVNTLNVLRARYKLRLKHKIFNKKSVDEKIIKLKKDYGFKTVFYRLKRVKSYKESSFQLDRELNIPILGKTQLPFFDEIGHRYDLEIYLSKRRLSPGGKKEKTNRIRYGVKTNYSKGFMPKIRYYHNDLAKEDDMIEVGSSLGIMYGIDRKFKEPPRMTFFQVDSIYYFTPTFREYFTPILKGLVYNSNSSRKDLGLLSYNYWLLEGVFAPGITLARAIKLYTGLGLERISFMRSENDPESSYQLIIERHSEVHPFLVSEIMLELIPKRYGNPFQKNISFKYNYYFPEEPFHKIRFGWHLDFEFRNRNIFSTKSESNFFWGTVPFYHEATVSSRFFKGLMGKGYYTKKIGSLSNEYLISIYRDFIYVGLYCDITLFYGSGHDLSGVQFAFVAGPAAQFLILDQFELDIYYGQDLLISKVETQGNISLSFVKKW